MWLLVLILVLSLYFFRDFFTTAVKIPEFFSGKNDINNYLRQENLNLQKKILSLEEEKNLYFLLLDNLLKGDNFPNNRAIELINEAKKCLNCIELCYSKKICDFTKIRQELDSNNFACRKTLLWCESFYLATNHESRLLLVQEFSLLTKWFSLYLNHLLAFCQFFTIQIEEKEILLLLGKIEQLR
jgi:hypothetical protein